MRINRVRRVVFDPDERERERKREIRRRIQKRYYERHKEEHLARCAEWRARNPEKVAAFNKARNRNDYEWRLVYHREYKRRYRTKLRAALQANN